MEILVSPWGRVEYEGSEWSMRNNRTGHHKDLLYLSLERALELCRDIAQLGWISLKTMKLYFHLLKQGWFYAIFQAYCSISTSLLKQTHNQTKTTTKNKTKQQQNRTENSQVNLVKIFSFIYRAMRKEMLTEHKGLIVILTLNIW